MSGTFCIVAQGGGMVTAYHAEVIRAWRERFGFTRVHRIIANSGAAANFSYVVSGQEHYIEPIWRDLVSSGWFVRSLWHLYRRGVMNIDFLVDEEIRKRYPLDLSALKESGIAFEVGVTHAVTGKSTYFSTTSSNDFYELLRASCAVPYFYGRHVLLDGEYWCDGTIGSVLGLERAMDENNILLILTRPPIPIKNLTLLRKILRYFLLRTEQPRLQEAVWNMPAKFNEALLEIQRMREKKNIAVIQPKRRLPMMRIDTSMRRLNATIEQGYDDTTAQYEALETFLKKCGG
ncbi:MAG: putative esterase of the alpha-beta hydrolase superfamily [Parcubacteria group bacterium Gr01-1014_48]|nr:MAG: putative esterase of the alpha-beta hydrolase superfamily [Parcubacteria group bacterium Gr01-1014_48]